MNLPIEAAGLKSNRTTIAMVGGGIAGLTTAFALQRQGVDFVLYERAPAMREVGAGLLLAPNALQALDTLGLYEAVTPQGRAIREWRVLDRVGRILQQLRPRLGQYSALSLHRAELQRLLYDRITPDRIRLGAEVAAMEPSQRGIEIRFVSGEKARADAVVGSDGIRSIVRSSLWGKRALEFVGYVGWRGVSAFIPEGYLGEHVSESWGEGERFGISPMGQGRCYWYATANRPEDFLSTVKDHKTELLRLFSHWHSPIASLIEATPEANIIASNLYDQGGHEPWTAGLVALIGDAAHAMTPNLGQGACMAIEDACVLAHCLKQSPAPDQAWLHFERLRRKRVAFIQRASRRMGAVIQIENPVGIALRNLIFRLTPSYLNELYMRRLFDFRR